MGEENSMRDAIDELFLKSLSLYGDAIEKFWIYESEICPCCKTRKLDTLQRDGGAGHIIKFIYIQGYECTYCIFFMQ